MGAYGMSVRVVVRRWIRLHDDESVRMNGPTSGDASAPTPEETTTKAVAKTIAQRARKPTRVDG